jgi:type III restriction enzyme
MLLVPSFGQFLSPQQQAFRETNHFTPEIGCEVPTQVLFPQMVGIVDHYVQNHIAVQAPGDLRDLHFSPYYGWLVEVLFECLRPDSSLGEAPEIPRYERSRGPGSTADVDFWTSRDVREVQKSHVNYVVADTHRWEQAAAYYIDTHKNVAAFVKNAGLGLAIPYLHNGQMHDYVPDFIIRLKGPTPRHLILETKGFDPLEDIKRSAAERWVQAVNSEGSYGEWAYRIAKKPTDIPKLLA